MNSDSLYVFQSLQESPPLMREVLGSMHYSLECLAVPLALRMLA